MPFSDKQRPSENLKLGFQTAFMIIKRYPEVSTIH